MRTYTAVYEREGERWLVDVPEVQGCHTFGRTLASARKNAFEAIAVNIDAEPDTFAIEDDIRLPGALEQIQHDAQLARDLAVELDDFHSAAMRQLVGSLHSEGWNMRDTGKAVGLSYQRIHQLLQGVESVPELSTKLAADYWSTYDEIAGRVVRATDEMQMLTQALTASLDTLDDSVEA